MTDKQRILDTEKAIEMLPLAADIYEKVGFESMKGKIKEKYKGKKNVDPVDPVLDSLKHIVRNAGKIKEEIFQIVSIAEGIEIEEVKSQSFGKTLKSLKEIFSDPELLELFK
ncbi:hypothetical protein [Evansella halocellulosilytica]|uniref:hypothetical protein n=1 Tax=Evansella halocellulosilytica TaxID=2011013 RepID=UPI000BB78754|nr:hypothetical protein [Evansella halocellulosilytica]